MVDDHIIFVLRHMLLILLIKLFTLCGEMVVCARFSGLTQGVSRLPTACWCRFFFNALGPTNLIFLTLGYSVPSVAKE
jgi:hypothetical protein